MNMLQEQNKSKGLSRNGEAVGYVQKRVTGSHWHSTDLLGKPRRPSYLICAISPSARGWEWKSISYSTYQVQFCLSVNKIESITLTRIGIFHLLMYWPLLFFFFLESWLNHNIKVFKTWAKSLGETQRYLLESTRMLSCQQLNWWFDPEREKRFWAIW